MKEKYIDVFKLQFNHRKFRKFIIKDQRNNIFVILSIVLKVLLNFILHICFIDLFLIICQLNNGYNLKILLQKSIKFILP